MLGTQLAEELCKLCKGKCEHFEKCYKETERRENIPQSEIDNDYACRLHPEE